MLVHILLWNPWMQDFKEKRGRGSDTCFSIDDRKVKLKTLLSWCRYLVLYYIQANHGDYLLGVVVEERPHRVQEIAGQTNYFEYDRNSCPHWRSGLALRLTCCCQDKLISGTSNLPRKCRDIAEQLLQAALNTKHWSRMAQYICTCSYCFAIYCSHTDATQVTWKTARYDPLVLCNSDLWQNNVFITHV